MVIVFLLMLLMHGCWCLMLQGTSTSYAQYEKWNAGLNGSLEFEFKTEQGNGLLLYTDDGGTNDFFEIKLVESALRLRYNLGGGAQILTVGHDLGDGNWHKIIIKRNYENTTLNVDGITSTSISKGKEYEFGHYSKNSDVYIGGMPSWYNNKLTLLALPSVIFEPKFNGFIRNLVYGDNNNIISRRQKIKNSNTECGEFSCSEESENQHKVIRSIQKTVVANFTDACETYDPCQHDGICISTDNGPVCECRSSNYEGEYCEKDKVPSEASFRGTEYLKIDLRDGQSILSIEESVSLQFKTRQHNGLIFYSGGGADYLSISIKDGGVAVGMTLANGRLDLHIKPSKIRFDDNQWHKIIVQRRVQEISTITRFCKLSAIVDGIYAEHAHTAGSFTRLESNQLLVGGGVESKSHQASRGITNFVGCLRKVLFKAEGEEIELIEAVKTSSRGASAWGRIDFHCREPKSDPVTFTTRESHLVLPPWKAAGSGSISFKLRTNEPDGLVMYSQSGAPARPDLFAFEILDGHLYLHMDLGSGHFKIRASKRRITNGTWHDIALRRVDRNGRVTVDGEATDFNTPGDSTQLDLDGLLYIGGVGVPFAPLTVPPVLWSGALRKGYVGCMRDLVINGQPVDIAGYAQQQDSSAIRPACHAHSSQCSSQPCMHGGVCIEGWNRFYCDCSATPFTGPICGKDASTLYLNGSQYMTALMPEDSKTQVEEISMRFKTSKPSGILLATSRENSFDRIQITLDQGTAKAKLHIGDQEKILYSSQGLNDDMWHILRFSRRATKIKLQIDDDPVLKAETQLESDAILEFRTLHVGGYQQTGDDLPNFVGHLQQVFFNGHPYLEIARSTGNYQSSHLGLSPIIRVTGKFAKRNHPVHRPVTFTSKHTFVGLPILKAYIETNLYFQFKTRETNGLIFFNAGRERDFIAVELVGGHIHYVFDLGDGPVRIKDSSKNRLNDGKWHAVSIGRPAPKRHTLSIDDHVTAVTSQGNNENLDLDGILYVGGVEKNQYAQLQQLSLLSRQGFEGCLASFEVSGESVDLMSDTVVTSSLVVSGCEISANIHSDKKCTHDICANYGTCVQQWSSYTCDCDMTSFSGPTCSDEAVAYEFGPGRGVIMYTFPNDKRTEMMKDIVAMGFITSNNDAVLLRVESATGNDYLEIEIVEGNVFAVYNTGSSDHPIGEVGVKVNDNQYHVIRFTRSGANATLQVDDYNLLANHPPGNQLKVFDGQSTVQVGGRWNQSKGRVERPFLGTISGLVLNGIRVLELAAAGSDKVFISIRGDVQLLPPGSLLERTAPLQRMQQTPASGLPGVMDDLIFSGAGSGCAGDDEDVECPPIYDLTSDDLITPVYVAPTKSPSFSKPINKKENIKDHPTCDDEEDCEEGSGDPGTTDNVIVTSTNKLNQVSSTTTQETPAHSTSTQVTSSSPILLSTEISTQLPHFNISTTDNESTHSSSTTSVSLRTISEITLTSTTSTSTSTTTTAPKIPEVPELPELPEIPEIPVYNPENYPIPPNPGKTKETHKTSIHSDAAKNAALIIAIIAGALIAIVLIILLILKFKNRPDAHYKSDKTKSFCQNPSAALLGGNASGQQYNSPLKTSTCENKNNKKRELKDIKEWYV